MGRCLISNFRVVDALRIGSETISLVLADTSVWIDHLKSASPLFHVELDRRRVLMHDFVLGELSLGNLGGRPKTLKGLHALPKSAQAQTYELLELVESNSLFGRGVGWVDCHLLAVVRMQPGVTLWTRDKRLFAAAQYLHLDVAGLH